MEMKFGDKFEMLLTIFSSTSRLSPTFNSQTSLAQYLSITEPQKAKNWRGRLANTILIESLCRRTLYKDNVRSWLISLVELSTNQKSTNQFIERLQGHLKFQIINSHFVYMEVIKLSERKPNIFFSFFSLFLFFTKFFNRKFRNFPL